MITPSIRATAICATAAFAACVHATDIHVPGDQPTIQAGIDAAADGDRVLVAENVYQEAIDFHGRNIQVLATGNKYRTRIDGRGHAHVVVFQSGETNASLSGFTIDGGIARGSGTDAYGGGILVAGTASPEIHDDFIIGNWACSGGAGIAVLDTARPRIHDNRLDHNATIHCSNDGLGGGLYVGSSAHVVVEHNRFYRNKAFHGAGIAILGGTYQESDTLVARNKIYRNEAVSSGGGIYTEGDHVRIADNLVDHNSAHGGGGIEVLAMSRIAHPVVANNTFADDYADTEVIADASPDGKIGMVNNIVSNVRSAYGVMCEPGARGTITLYDTLVYVPEGETSQGDCAFDGTLITQDPRFAEIGQNRYYWLRPGSPAIDAGENTAAEGYNKYDLTGGPRIVGPAVDLGAIEYRGD